MTRKGNSTLYLLGDRGQTIEESANDIRGREVKDRHGAGIGKIADLLVDEQGQRVRFLLVEHGGFLGVGETKTLLPVEAVTKITPDEVFIDQSRDRIAAAPNYDPELVDDQPYHASIYLHYGHAPYWSEGYVYPPLMSIPPNSPPRIWV